MPDAARCGAPPDHPEDLPRVRDGRRHRPGEHFRVPLRYTPRTELIKGGTTGIRHQDFCHARGDAMPYELVQGIYQVLPKTDIRGIVSEYLFFGELELTIKRR